MEEKKPKKLTKAEKKLAKKLAKEQMLLQIRRDTLAREAALDAATLSKIKEKWCDSLITSKIPEMQDNLRHILHYMEKFVEAESFRNIQFEEEREELEEKVALLAKSQSTALDMLFGIYQKRVKDMQSTFDLQVSERKFEAESEFKSIEEHENITQENIEIMLFKMEKNREEKEYAMNCNIFLKLDDERSKNTEIQENLKSKLQKKMEKRWGEIKTTLSKYEESTRDRRAEYLKLKAKDDADSRTIQHQMKKTQQMLEQLEEMKNFLDGGCAPQGTVSVMDDLREERSLFFSTFNSLKAIVAAELKDDDELLKNLTDVSNYITKDLRKLVKTAENILTLYRICLKFETEQEKVKPVGEALEIPKELAKTLLHIPKDINKQLKNMSSENYINNESPNEPEGPSLQDFQVLSLLWKKIGRVHLSKLALGKCIQNMVNENDFLKKCLSCYMKEYAAKKETL